jgi:hypothetical protein
MSYGHLCASMQASRCRDRANRPASPSVAPGVASSGRGRMYLGSTPMAEGLRALAAGRLARHLRAHKRTHTGTHRARSNGQQLRTQGHQAHAWVSHTPFVQPPSPNGGLQIGMTLQLAPHPHPSQASVPPISMCKHKGTCPHPPQQKTHTHTQVTHTPSQRQSYVPPHARP